MERLIKNISDQIIEAQIKLGFASETMRFYYPLDSINYILNTDYSNGDELVKYLNNKIEIYNSYLGNLGISNINNRIEISVGSNGVEYVYKNLKPSQFLVDIINLFMNNHHCEIKDIKSIFEKYSKNYVCERMKEDADFDYVFYFENPDIDEYYYCVKMEMGHSIYHRFTKEDYERILKNC